MEQVEDQDYSDSEPQINKKIKTNNYSNQVSDEEIDEEELLQALEEAEKDEELGFNKGILIKLIDQIDLIFTKNQQQREKYANQPENFLESEEELHNVILKLYSVCAYPDLISVFINSDGLLNMILSFKHQNIDIVQDAINFFYELLQVEIEENLQKQLLQRFINNNFLEVAVENLKRYNETINEDSEAYHKTLGILERLLELMPSISKIICDKTKLLHILVKRIQQNLKYKVIDDNKLYCSEILNILLQDPSNQFTFLKINGLEFIVKYISQLLTQQPQSEEQKEIYMNIFDSLCILMIKPVCQELFFKDQGIELLLEIIKLKSFSSAPALKVLRYSFINNEDICNYFIDLQGLKYIFPIMIKRGIKSKKGEEQQEIEEQIFQSIKLLLKQTKSINQERVVNKFRDKDFEKIHRLFEIHLLYYDQVKMEENEIKDIDNQDLVYMNKVQAGLNILESIDYIIAFLSTWKDEDIVYKVKQIIQQKPLCKQQIIEILNESLNELQETAIEEQKNIKQIIQNFQNL